MVTNFLFMFMWILNKTITISLKSLGKQLVNIPIYMIIMYQGSSKL